MSVQILVKFIFQWFLRHPILNSLKDDSWSLNSEVNKQMQVLRIIKTSSETIQCHKVSSWEDQHQLSTLWSILKKEGAQETVCSTCPRYFLQLLQEPKRVEGLATETNNRKGRPIQPSEKTNIHCYAFTSGLESKLSEVFDDKKYTSSFCHCLLYLQLQLDTLLSNRNVEGPFHLLHL